MAVEMREATKEGLAVALLCVRGPIIRQPMLMHPEIQDALSSGGVQLIDPETRCETDLVLIHHPSLLANHFNPRPSIDAKNVLVVLHHPAVDNAGEVSYDPERVLEHAEAAFGVPAKLASVSSVVRKSLPIQFQSPEVAHPDDWLNLIDPLLWPQRKGVPEIGAAVIGRHSRPHPQKWPDSQEDAEAAWPQSGVAQCRILGAGPYLSELYGTLPKHWELLEFNEVPVAEFLRSLDFWIYFHSDDWCEAFGRATLEAILSGCVVILPSHFKNIFGDAALYSKPSGVADLIREMSNDPVAWQTQADNARRIAIEKFGARNFIARIERYLSEPNFSAPVPNVELLPKKSVLFISSNGIGIGHLAQQMAIADRLPTNLQPFFATMSYSRPILAESGYPAEFFPHHANAGLAPEDWNSHLAEQLYELMVRLRPRVVVYDATAVFGGVISALETYREAFTVWVRRPMWQEAHRTFSDHLWFFDAVLEPGELAEELDQGPTKEQQSWVFKAPPVLHIDPTRRLARKVARSLLELPDEAQVIALQIGPGSNFDLSETRERVIDYLMRRTNVIVLELLSPIKLGAAPKVRHPLRHRQIALFPSFRYSAAFDAAVCNAGYNAFHENLIGQIPTLFIPNEGPNMDIQVNRAIWAELTGRGWLHRRYRDEARLENQLNALLDPAAQQAVKSCCARLTQRNGAEDFAEFVASSARIIRSDRAHGVHY